ncbi:MAG: DUF2891 domain-containing protein [Acidobacteriota bacterium]
MRAARRGAFSLLLLALSAAAAAQAPAENLDDAAAERFARLALSCIDREYPNKPEHVLDGAADLRAPRDFHPVFFGCYDWHSSVHGHWMLVRLLETRPGIPAAAAIRDRLDAHFTAESIAREVAYLDRKSARSFERTYGWAWILRLALELEQARDLRARAWRESFRPLEAAVASRLRDYLPKLTSPVRTGVHPNTAFALGEALDWARGTGHAEDARILETRSRDFFFRDRGCPLAYEPSGEDFFSPCLEEADLMRRVLPSAEFSSWLTRFLPEIAAGRPVPLAPAAVSDPTDPKLVHLDGLNLSRAWSLAGIASALSKSDARRRPLQEAARAHARAGLSRVSSGNYEGEHWLASFAVRLLASSPASR